jgi:hypothetical protein
MNITFYKIYCKDINITDCYIGSTINFNQRKKLHKSVCNNEKHKYYNLKVYIFIRENGGWDNWIMEELESKNCESNEEARIREQELIVEFNATLNMIGAIFNKEKYNQRQKEYQEKNREILNQKSKKYYEVNKKIILQKQKEYYQKKNQPDLLSSSS